MSRRPWYAAARAAHAAAAPASTLIIITLFLLLLAGFARATLPDGDPAVHVSERASPERTIDVAVEAPAGEAITASLPGLDLRPSRLSYDARSGYHLATLALPHDAPARGWCTVRITFPDQSERDVQVALDLEPSPES